MTLALAANGTIAVAGPTAVKFALFGDEIAATIDAFKTLAQGSVSVSPTVVYTATAVQAIIKTITLFNTAGTSSTVAVYVNGTTAAFQIYAANIPAGGAATYGQDGWRITDSSGSTVTSATVVISGDASGSGPASNVAITLATVNANVGSFGSASSVGTFTANAKGLLTAAASTPILITESQVTGLVSDLGSLATAISGKQPVGNYLTALTGDGTATGPGSSVFTLATVTTAQTVGDASHVAAVTTDVKGRVTGMTSVAITIASAAVTGLTFFATLANLTGDITTSGTGATTLATFGPGAIGPIGSATQVAAVSTDAKGRVSALSAVSIQIAESQVTNLVTDLAGKQPTGNYITALTGDATATGPGSVAITLATVNAGVGAFGSATASAVVTATGKGLITALSSVPIQIAESQVTNLVTDLAGKQPTGNYITALTGDVTAAGPGSVAATLATVNPNVGTFGSTIAVPVITFDGKGRATAVTTAAISTGGGLTGWIDVATQASPVLPANAAGTNDTRFAAILAAAPNGSTIYIPHGIYLFSAAWTMPANKAFTFQGQGSNRAGSPGTAFTEIQLTTNLAATFITLNNVWYTQFRDLVFTAGATQTVGACIDVGNNVGTNFFNCAFQSPNTTLAPTTFWNDVLVGSSANSWNSAIISGCNMSAFKGRGVFCDGAGSSLVIEKSVIQGQWGPTSGTPAAASAVAGIEGQNVGALQINDCDILGSVNNLLLDPASGKVCASVFCTNTYFDSAAGSCIKIAGAGATVRARFDTCSFTTAGTNFTTAGTNLSAVEIGGSFVFGAGGQGIDFVNCNVLNTFGTTGTATGFLVTNAADFSIGNCRVAGWPGNGINITPMASNKTFPQITNNTIGPAGGYGANGTGINIAAGAFKGLVIQNNAVINNTNFNLTLGAVTLVSAAEAGFFRITDNAGINPKGAVTPPVATPVSTTVYTNTTGFRVNVFFKAVTTITNMSINGQATVFTGGANASGFVQLDPGGTFAYTFTGAGSWFWIAN